MRRLVARAARPVAQGGPVTQGETSHPDGTSHAYGDQSLRWDQSAQGCIRRLVTNTETSRLEGTRRVACGD